ncbi:DUF11 domain-containing protein [Arsenicibacter rosenii]|uniref:DUF11 domain-containing protein n=1 Tax=Arsenicibacter rosenii TaxID=1750698 RepID=A0A1S2VMM2_9BACT|nr:DUF11 domain-containing protein [Arsenicibacter rosenii]OIN59640.1 hypothetical protein BLX24_07150 [Arsenicibacter rosenii]
MIFALPLWVTAQIDATFPQERMVFQRSNNNQATVQIAGSYSQAFDRISVDVINRISGATAMSNVTLQTNLSGGQFNGAVILTGGWWKVVVKGIVNNAVVATDTIQRVGVGEVLAIMGHSNAQGSTCSVASCNYECNLCPTISGASDDRVTCVQLNDNNTANFSSPNFSIYENTADPAYLPGSARFAKLDTYVGEAPFARFAWFWGYVGDLLVQQLGVPVLFYNAGFGGSNMEHTYKSAYDIPFEHGFIRYDLRMPYVNMRNIMNLYIPTTGIRGVLLQHGENDRSLDAASIQMYNVGVIDKVRTEFSMPNLAWSMAISSYAAGADWANVKTAQQNVINTANYNVYQGPDLSQINSDTDRPDQIHFSSTGQQKVGVAWANALLTTNFFAVTTPYTGQLQPVTSINCATGNQLTISQPANYNRYLWDNGPTTQAITAGQGTYSARIRNTQNQYYFPPAVVVPANVTVATPVVMPSSATLCDVQSLTLTSGNAVKNLWSTGATSQSIVVSGAGQYSVQAVNPVYGCLSAPATATVTAGAAFTPVISPSSSTLSSGQNTTLTASGCTGAQQRWSTGATASFIIVNPTVTTTYSLSCWSTSTCVATTSVTIYVPTSNTVLAADLSLLMTVNNRTPQVNDVVTYTISIRNSGPGSATTVSFEDRLPANLNFVSSPTLSFANGTVSGLLSNLAAGSTASHSFQARVTAAGSYQNAAEIMGSTNPDPNSQPGSGTGDGQDDAATADLRTRLPVADAVYASPNPNQVSLPPVQSNQPASSSTGADLSLRMVSGTRTVSVGQTVSFTIIVSNDGGLTATNIAIGNEFPAGLQFLASPNLMTFQNGLLTANISQLPAGQSTWFSFTATVTSTGQLIQRAQVTGCSQPDPDSTPNNGSQNGEDDTANIDIRSI